MWERMDTLNINLSDNRVIDWVVIDGIIWVKIQAACEKVTTYLKNYPEERGRLQLPSGSQA